MIFCTVRIPVYTSFVFWNVFVLIAFILLMLLYLWFYLDLVNSSFFNYFVWVSWLRSCFDRSPVLIETLRSV